MRTSRYNLYVWDFPRRGNAVVFNTRTSALLEMDLQTAQRLKDGELGGLESETLSLLQENGLVVDSEDPYAELEASKEDLIRLGLDVTLLTTYDCNFACPYCFEKGIKRPSYMSLETAGRVLDWVRGWVRERGYPAVSFTFYGGEPLLNKDVIDFFLASAKGLAPRVAFFLFSNGSLLEEEDILRWRSAGLREIRVTIDGPEDLHDRRRPFRDGRGSFWEIVDRLKKVIPIVKVSLNVNLCDEGYSRMEELFQILASELPVDRIASLIVSPVIPAVADLSNRPYISETLVSLFSSGGAFEGLIGLVRKARRYGFNVRIPLSRYACPLLVRDGGIIVDTEGSLYKCSSMVGHEEFRIGTVEEGFNQKFQEFLSLRPWEDCPEDCPYLPICQGGCRLFSLFETGDLRKSFCRRDFFDRYFPEVVKLEYEFLCGGS